MLYIFDPRRAALLLIGGDKTGNDAFYEELVPAADRIYDQHLRELGRNFSEITLDPGLGQEAINWLKTAQKPIAPSMDHPTERRPMRECRQAALQTEATTNRQIDTQPRAAL